MNNSISALLLAVVALSPCISQAHDETMLPDCNKSFMSETISSDMDRKNFELQLNLYEKCIFDYIKAQHKQAQVHQQAAEQAIDVWAIHLQEDIP